MTIKDIDNDLFKISQQLDKFAAQVDFVDFHEFILETDLKCTPDLPPKKNGIYRFDFFIEDDSGEVSDWMKNFCEEWINTDVTWVPGTRKKRISQHKELREWIPLYIGKSKDVRQRVLQHLYQKIDATTFGMKLMGRKNLYGKKFRVSWIPLEITHYDFIAPALEQRLRNRFHPIVGR